jgi:two-component system, chemotaxis family, sensor kinase CheA
MAIDMEQFKVTFIEESLEGLDSMEAALLDLDTGAADSELVNTIFRAAHSIKGGAATFSFTDIAEFTHVAETLLDQVRAGERDVTQQIVDVLLQSVDCLREMLAAGQDSEEVDKPRVAELKSQLEQILGAEESSGESDTDSSASSTESSANSGWVIKFKPHPHMMETGNNPVLMFRELESFGDLEVSVDCSALPALEEMVPEQCYLAWELTLSCEGNISRDQINEVFDWVEGECDLEIMPLVIAESVVAEETTPEEKTTVLEESDSVSGELLSERRKDSDRRKQTDRRTTGAKSSEASSIRVGIDKVDDVINLVGELVITQSMLGTLGEDFNMEKIHKLLDGLGQLERNTRELQESVMRMRMLPISFSFSRFPRMVRDMSQKLNKKIELVMLGEQTELDKTVIEKIGDPLVHLVRNALDHGLEMPDERIAAGKPETGTVTLNAYHKGGNIIIEVKEDGRGLNVEKIKSKAIERGIIPADADLNDDQINDLIFMAGFSTADVVSDVSGRGVGMDVVRRNIQSLGGTVGVKSIPGQGSTFTVSLPLTLAILDGQTIAVGEENYIVPLVSIVESIQVKSEMVNYVGGKGEVFKLRNEYVPIIRLYEVFGAKPTNTQLEEGLLVVVEGEGKRIGLFIDELQGQQQVVIKSLEANYKKVAGISGATILGDGSVALILDVPGLIRLANQGIFDQRKSA